MIAVDLNDPPEWIVTVGHPDTTWPCRDREHAESFARAMIESGQYVYTMRKAVKNQPARKLTLVTMWQRAGQDGHTHYVAMEIR